MHIQPQWQRALVPVVEGRRLLFAWKPFSPCRAAQLGVISCYLYFLQVLTLVGHWRDERCIWHMKGAGLSACSAVAVV